MNTRLLCGVAAFLTFGVASGQVTPSVGGAYLFRARHVAGTTSYYLAAIVAMGQTVTNSVDEKVAKVRNGVATLNIQIGPAVEARPKQILHAPQKNVVRVDGLNRPVGASGVPNILAEFPKSPIKIGAVWTGLQSFSMGSNSGVSLATSYRFSSIQHSKGKTIAVLDVLLKGFANGSGAMLIDTADGSLLASSLTLQIVALGKTQIVQMQVRRK